MTNGILFDEKHWQELRKYYENEVQVLVSIDAATADTYKKIRSGDFNRLLSSLEYIKKLREGNQITWFGLNFVIQRGNADEIFDFVDLGKKYKVDEIYFGHLDNWGTYSEEEFENKKMFVENTRVPKDELVKLLEDGGEMQGVKINWQKINENFRIRGFHGNGVDKFR